MRESDLAAQMQAEKDDLSQWEEVTAPTRSGKRKLTAMVSVRLSPEELERVQAHAEESGQSVSAYLRNLALRDAAKDAPEQENKNRVVARTQSSPFGSVIRVDVFSRGPNWRQQSVTYTTTSPGMSQGLEPGIGLVRGYVSSC